jgi:hypothetical protein
MINPDSNNSILRTNIFSKRIGGKKHKKNKTLKKRKGGFISEFFRTGPKPCAAEENNYNQKRIMQIKDAKIAMKNYRDEFNKRLRMLQQDADSACREYNAAQQTALTQYQQNKPKEHKYKIQYKGGKLFEKESKYYDKIINQHMKETIKMINKYKGGASSDYCTSVIEEYQDDVKQLKQDYNALIHNYIEKNYNEPVNAARRAFNKCALEYNEGEAELPMPAKPRVYEPKYGVQTKSDNKKFLASMLDGPEYVNGRIQKPTFEPTGDDKSENKLDSWIKYGQERLKEQNTIREMFKDYMPQQQSKKDGNKDNDISEITIKGTKHHKNKINNMSKTDKDKLLNDLNEDIKAAKAKNKGNLSDLDKTLRNDGLMKTVKGWLT